MQKYLESALAQAFPLPVGVTTQLVISQDMSGRYQSDTTYTAPTGSAQQIVSHLWMGARFGVDLDDLANRTISAIMDAGSIRVYEDMLTQSVSAAQQAFVNGTGSQEALIAAQRGVLALAAQSRVQRQAVFDGEQKRQADLQAQKAAAAGAAAEQTRALLVTNQRIETEQATLNAPPCCGLVAVGGPVTTPAALAAAPATPALQTSEVAAENARDLAAWATGMQQPAPGPPAGGRLRNETHGSCAGRRRPWWIVVVVVLVLLVGGSVIILRR